MSRVRTGYKEIWKNMKLKNFIFQARKVIKLNCRSWKVLENLSYRKIPKIIPSFKYKPPKLITKKTLR